MAKRNQFQLKIWIFEDIIAQLHLVFSCDAWHHTWLSHSRHAMPEKGKILLKLAVIKFPSLEDAKAQNYKTWCFEYIIFTFLQKDGWPQDQIKMKTVQVPSYLPLLWWTRWCVGLCCFWYFWYFYIRRHSGIANIYCCKTYTGIM